MSAFFEELDYQQTALGELILRRRRALEMGGREVYEVKLNEEFLMSSLFHDAEVALTDLGLAGLAGDAWDIVVGGLGLGYTAAAALKYSQVARMTVVEALAPVIDWHQRELVPNGALLSNDDRCRYVNADFFALARGDGFDPDEPGHQFDAILLDIDHTPDALLNPSHADFYSTEGLMRLRAFLKPGGIFAMWSNDAPEKGFLDTLASVFAEVHGHVVEFENPIQGNTAENGVYVGKK
ncbi:spermidine synthase [Desulfoluna butyratoxydans]|uniref:S-adenosyl-l-methionine-dependent methyltransferase n=1 Tax=Desulfoluna butyratoxydans TaxID=231438 RepID=A0A4U8YKM0_9BACT|nr:spermidine synthase [Desulfoluna butyratoxydans]VFQ43914.1 s-adenosyl-l-methionine-dependent methyltransferase [Desulfoluna butyratoxydans]